MNIRYITYSLLTLLIFLLSLELFSFVFLKINQESKPYFINVKQDLSKVIDSYTVINYTEVDPLLGWSLPNNLLSDKGFEIFSGCIELNSCNESVENFKILVTGGSTSDLTYNIENWPMQLRDILSANNFCVQIIVASVAGYNSGQELLKLLRLQIDFVPDIHISYSGANEAENPSYTSYYERQLYEKILSDRSSAIMPNTVFLIRKYLFKNKLLQVSLKEPVNFDPVAFWLNNMQNFYAIAQNRNYHFIGILQPVLSQGGIFQKEEMEALPNYMRDYEEFYPNAKTLVDTKDYLYDFTCVFSGVEGKVFKDDCHLSDVKYQRIVADSVFNLIKPLLDSKK